MVPMALTNRDVRQPTRLEKKNIRLSAHAWKKGPAPECEAGKCVGVRPMTSAVQTALFSALFLRS
jgi:hypothetical protein